MKEFPLDKYLATGTEYETAKRQALLIEAAGTDSSSEAILYVECKGLKKEAEDRG